MFAGEGILVGVVNILVVEEDIPEVDMVGDTLGISVENIKCKRNTFK